MYTVWLKELNGQRAFFPEPTNSHFLFASYFGSLCFQLEVQGYLAPVGNSTSNPNPGASIPQAVVAPGNPLVAHTRRGVQTANVKVVQAKVKRNRAEKPQFSPMSSMYVEVTEGTANVQFLSQAIQGKWGGDHVIVLADGLIIENGTGTQGELIKTLDVNVWFE